MKLRSNPFATRNVAIRVSVVALIVMAIGALVPSLASAARLHPASTIPLGRYVTSTWTGTNTQQQSTVTGNLVTVTTSNATGSSFGVSNTTTPVWTTTTVPSYIPDKNAMKIHENCLDIACGTLTLTFSKPVTNLSMSLTDMGGYSFTTTTYKLSAFEYAKMQLPVGFTWEFRGSTTHTSNIVLTTTTRVLGITLTLPSQKIGATVPASAKTTIEPSCTLPYGCFSAVIKSATPITTVTINFISVNVATRTLGDGMPTNFAFTTPSPSEAGSFLAATATKAGFYIANSSGQVINYDAAPSFGTLPSDGVHVSNIVGIAANKCATGGYWLVGSDGGVFSFGGATFEGSLPLLHVTPVAPIVAIAPTSDCGGYWLLGRDGGIFAFGDAIFYGSLPDAGIHVSNIVAFSPTLSGTGYVLVGSDGGIFAFGDGTFYGSIPSVGAHASNIIGITNLTGGYYVVGSNGGVYSFGTAQFQGSLGATTLSEPIVGLIPLGGAYALVNAQGGAFFFPRA